MRDKYKKEYDHYLKKTAKMKAEREAKRARNPTNIETAKDVEWHLRNDRKLETARCNLITMSQQSYASAKECIKLRFDYMMPILDTFSKNLTKFINGVKNAIVGLPEVPGEIQKARQMQQEKDAEERIKELRIEEEKLRKLQEVREQMAKEKREREQQEQEKMQRELEEKRREILSKFPSNAAQSPAELSPQKSKGRDSLSSQSSHEDEYFQEQGVGRSESGSFHCIPSRQLRPAEQHPSYYPTADHSYEAKQSEATFYSQPVPRTTNYYEQPRVRGSYYEQPRPEAEYYEQPRPRGTHYRQPRPRPETNYMAGYENDTYAPNDSFPPQKPEFSPNKRADWDTAQPRPRPLQTRYRPPPADAPTYGNPFADAFSQHQPTYQDGGGGKRPRNPFTGGYARPEARPPIADEQFDFLGLCKLTKISFK
eukprot:TRINITY_DN12599_c0_g2_i13.p1 TRINITY_DN12599_c0_g2~~TRINITY_DN12599_c0_g2_i13.p1  ORF type:complete len:425 (-),score=95.95 TRINITY_DN12599_c0_g2_i13:132-1406(-)